MSSLNLMNKNAELDFDSIGFLSDKFIGNPFLLSVTVCFGRTCRKIQCMTKVFINNKKSLTLIDFFNFLILLQATIMQLDIRITTKHSRSVQKLLRSLCAAFLPSKWVTLANAFQTVCFFWSTYGTPSTSPRYFIMVFSSVDCCCAEKDILWNISQHLSSHLHHVLLPIRMGNDKYMYFVAIEPAIFRHRYIGINILSFLLSFAVNLLCVL